MDVAKATIASHNRNWQANRLSVPRTQEVFVQKVVSGTRGRCFYVDK